MVSSPNLRVVVPAPAPARSEPGDVDALVARALVGDMGAWGILYQRHFAGVTRHACFLSGDAAAAEDLAQEAFARALASLATFAGRSSFSTWLHGIVINTVRKHRETQLRQHRVRERAAGVVAATAVDDELDRRTLRQARMQALYQILERLPNHLRDAFVLRDLLGLSAAEAAAQLDITEENLRVRAHRARGRVHDELVTAGWIDARPPTGGTP